jgi:hypothetical protein
VQQIERCLGYSASVPCGYHLKGKFGIFVIIATSLLLKALNIVPISLSAHEKLDQPCASIAKSTSDESLASESK